MSEGAQETRVFASRYRPGVAHARPAGCLFAPLLILPGLALFKQLFIAVAVAAVVYVGSLIVLAALRRRRPALLLSDAGAEIDGLPLLPWREVASVRRDPDSRGETGLVIRLRRPIAAAAVGRLRGSPLWRPFAEDAVLLRAGLLEDPPGEVESAFRYFLGR